MKKLLIAALLLSFTCLHARKGANPPEGAFGIDLDTINIRTKGEDKHKKERPYRAPKPYHGKTHEEIAKERETRKPPAKAIVTDKFSK